MKGLKLVLCVLLTGIIFSLSNVSYANSPHNPTAPALPQIKAETDEQNGDSAIDSGGLIGSNEIVCDQGTPEGIRNIDPPSGEYIGFLVIRWEKKTIGGTWEVIPGANVLDYFPTHITETTVFRRGCRETVSDIWKYSNETTKTVVAGIEEVKVTGTDVICKGGNSGSAQSVVVGGSPGYTYSWSNGGNDNYVNGLSAGNYSLTVTDRNGCTFHSDNFEVSEPERSVEINDSYYFEPSCPGSSDGGIVVEASGGVAPYNYTWSSGSTEADNFGIPAGEYDVTVVDALGCQFTINDYPLNQPKPFKLNQTTQDITCFGDDNGQAKFEIKGGTAPYYYTWPDGSNEVIRSDLAPGSYDIDVVDYNGCSFKETIVIEQPDLLEVSPYTVSNRICQATVNVVPEGGIAPYTYEWEDGATSNTRTGLCPGEYKINVTDDNGCETTQTLRIVASYVKDDINIQVSVNPFMQSGNILVTLPYTAPANVTVYNSAGQLVEEFLNLDGEANNEIELALNLSKYSNGIYFVHVWFGNLTKTEKIAITN